MSACKDEYVDISRWFTLSVIHDRFSKHDKTITLQIKIIHQNLIQKDLRFINKSIAVYDIACPHVAEPAIQKPNQLCYQVLPHSR